MSETIKHVKKKKPTAQKGVVLLAFGNRQYMEMAFNMACSLKFHNPDIVIQVATEERFYSEQYSWAFDIVTILGEKITHRDGKLNPAQVKCAVYDIAYFKHNLYLDVDGCALADVTPLLDKLSEEKGYYRTVVIGWGSKEEEDYEYNIWAKHSDLWDHYNLTEEAKIPAIQSSVAYFRKPDSAKFFEIVKAHDKNRLDVKDLTMTWGPPGSPRDIFPDELTFNVSIAKMGIKPDIEPNPIYFGQRHEPNLADVLKRKTILSIYGNKGLTHPTVLKYYDRYMSKVMRKYSRMHEYKSHRLIKYKHANGK